MRPTWPFVVIVLPLLISGSSNNDCNKNGCLHGGICNTTSGVCDCGPKWNGPTCSELIAEQACSSHKCVHGTCFLSNTTYGYRCDCEKRYRGFLCNKDKNECMRGADCGGAKCINHVPKEGSKFEEDPGFSCVCPTDRNGTNCEIEVDLCAPTDLYNSTNPFCQNGAACIRSRCLCADGFTGDRCQIAVPYRWELEENGCGVHNDAVWVYCLDHFADGTCDQDCSSEQCWFDGLDCAHPYSAQNDTRPEGCAVTDLCSRVYNNGVCDEECNVLECGFDGGDCEDNTHVTNVDSSAIGLVVDAPPHVVLHNLRALQAGIGKNIFNGRVRVASDSVGELIFEWNTNAVVPKRWLTEYANAQTYGKRLFPDLNRPETWRDLSNEPKTLIYFDIDTTDCKRQTNARKVRFEHNEYFDADPDVANCFENVDIAARYLEIKLVRGKERIAENLAIVDLHVAYKEAPRWRYFLPWALFATVVLFFMLIVGVLLGVTKLTSNRTRELSAPVWKVPTDSDNDNSSPPSSPNKLSEVPFDGKHTRLSERVYPYPLENDPPLLSAVRRGDSGAVSEIISSLEGKNIDVVDGQGLGALHHAIANNDDTVLGILLQSGGFDVFAKNRQGQSALVYASRVGHRHLECYSILVQEIGLRKIPADMPVYSTKSLPAPLAGEHDARWALTDDMGRNSIHYAAVNNMGDVIHFMYSYGADVNLVDNEGSTPMHLACRGGRMEAVEALVECHASTNIADAEGRCPVQLAEQRGYWSLVYMLRNVKVEESAIPRALHGMKRPCHMMSPTYCITPPPRKLSEGYFSFGGSGVYTSDSLLSGSTTLSIPLTDVPSSMMLEQMDRESSPCGEMWKAPRLDSYNLSEGHPTNWRNRGAEYDTVFEQYV